MKWTKRNLPVVGAVPHKRSKESVPIKRSVLIDNNKYRPHFGQKQLEKSR